MGSGQSKWGSIGGTALIVLGVSFLVDEFFNINVLGNLWPLLLVGLGVHLLVQARKKG